MCGSSGDRPPPPSANGGGTCPAGGTEQTCPLQKPHLVELVEVVARSPLGVVVGAGAASGKLATKTTRSDKNGGNYKQYINLDKDIDGADKRHPEHDRYVELRARIEGGGSLAGQTVRFSCTKTDGPDRPAGMTALTGSAAHGFGSAGGDATTDTSTDAEGWTGTVSFYLSQYAGDSFEVSAQLLEGGAPTGPVKKIGTYEVWRKFWYQSTRATTHVIAAPAKSVAAYVGVHADMLAAEEATFTAADTPAHTFYPGWMVKTGGGDADESVIGGHNRTHFYPLFKDKAGEPVKGHLIFCQHQWDPFGVSDLVTANVTTNPSADITVNLSWNAGIVKPALSGDLVSSGKWKKGTDEGPLTDADIQVVKGRPGLTVIKVKLPAGAPDPTAGAVAVELKLRYGKFYAGESNGKHMLIRENGDNKQLTQVISHEFGHGFGQTPRDGTQPAPLAKHPKQYDDAHGGQGSHCSDAATEVVDATMTSGKRWTGGTCIMFHQVNPSGCTQLFCATCRPYLRLREMTALS